MAQNNKWTRSEVEGRQRVARLVYRCDECSHKLSVPRRGYRSCPGLDLCSTCIRRGFGPTHLYVL